MSGEVVNIAGYRFTDMPDRDDLRQPFRDLCEELDLKGTILLAHEGINFFLAGSKTSVESFVTFLEADKRFSDIPLKISYSDYQPFRRMNVRLKKEIISLGLDHIKPAEMTGDEITPMELKQILDAGKEVIVLDTRNEYECRIGTFENALELNIRSFRDFPKAIEELDENLKDKPVVMFCTGGIRCEKASVYLEKKGFSNVYQLKGGILNYLKKTDQSKSLWQGECFVFDNRVSLKHGLKLGSYSICSGCRKPISSKNKNSEKYEEGVSCPNCHDKLTDQQKTRFRMRQKQINLAKKVGKRHIFQKEY